MIKLPDGELRDYLPPSMKNDTGMICLSYAMKKAAKQLAQYRKAAMIYRFIDSAPETVLDLLAAELRSLYYSDIMPLETKRKIVKNTLRWHAQAGTPGAVKEMIEVVFGEGEVVEWPDFDEPPYTPGTFDIITEAELTPDILGYFASVIDRVKNVRSHLRRILIRRECLLQVHTGVGMWMLYKNATVAGGWPADGYRQERAVRQTIYAGAGSCLVCHPQSVTDGYHELRAAGQKTYTGIASRQQYRQTVLAEQGG